MRLVDEVGQTYNDQYTSGDFLKYLCSMLLYAILLSFLSCFHNKQDYQVIHNAPACGSLINRPGTKLHATKLSLSV